MADKSARIVANGSNKQLETVNIVTSQPAKAFKKYTQVTAAQAAAAQHEIETLQDSGGTIKGLRTIQITGYVGPN